MARFVHFDIPCDDIKRAKKFYENVFDWKIEKMPGEYEYYGITTEEGAMRGGMGQRQGDQKITNYVGTEDIEKSMNEVKKYGGKIITPKMEVEGYGWLVTCEDTEGNIFGLWQTT